MEKFSVEILKDKIKLYKCNKEEYKNIFSKYNLYNDEDILCKTILEDEITFYYFIKQGNNENHYSHHILSKICVSDPRYYSVIDIYEDIPGIDHVGIIYKISKLFLEKNIPILYINTYGHNLIIISDEYLSKALETLKNISQITTNT
jgi:hypothetical protein